MQQQEEEKICWFKRRWHSLFGKCSLDDQIKKMDGEKNQKPIRYFG